MSEPMNNLELENKNLKLQLENQTQGVENLLSQLDAHKGMINDSTALILQLRTNLVLFQKELTKVCKQNELLKKDLDEANAKLKEPEQAAAPKEAEVV